MKGNYGWLHKGSEMRLAIMQPYFMPYIGYFQLIAAVDRFILYDNIKYTKKGWINRNRMLKNGREMMFALPLKNGSDFLNICERELAADFKRNKLLNQFREAYRHAPYFGRTILLVEQILQYENVNLFSFLHHSIVKTCEHLRITTKIIVSSDVTINHDLKSQDKVLALCEAAGANRYVNTIGGMELYSKEVFRERGIELKFIKAKPFGYVQFGNEFVPWLSIIDIMMFNPLDKIQACIFNDFELI
jgi:hypothetical protein